MASDGTSKGKGLEFDLNMEAVDVNNSKSPEEPDPCPICYEPLGTNTDDPRTVVTLQCSHKYHLDCIGSAFNAKGFMECPNCKQIEPGEWRYAAGYVDDDDDDSIADEEEVEEMNPGPFNGLTLGSEMCPFERFPRPFEAPNPFVGRTDAGQCMYEEILIPVSQYSAFSRQWTSRTGEVPHRNGSLIDPLSRGSTQSSGFLGNLPPTDRRMFWSNYDAETMRGRHYLEHPNFDHTTFFGGSNNNLVHVPMTMRDPRSRWMPNAPMTMGSNHASTSYGGSRHVNGNGFNRFNRSERLPPLEELGQSEIEREFIRMINSDDGGRNRRRRRTIDELFGLNGGGSGNNNSGGSGGGGNGNGDGLSGGSRS